MSTSPSLDERRLNLSDWHNGIIAGVHQSNPSLVHFVCTSRGLAVAYPRLFVDDKRLQLGSYVRVRTIPPVQSHQNAVVEQMELQERPSDHAIDVTDMLRDVEVICNAVLIDRIDNWFVFENDYLGRIVMREDLVPRRQLRKGPLFRVCCWRVRSNDGLADSTIQWKAQGIDYADKLKTANRWLEGVITRYTDRMINVTCAELADDAVIFDSVISDDLRRDHESLMGCWLRFRLLPCLMFREPLRYRVDQHSYSEIKAPYETRMQAGLPEIRLRCSFLGEYEDRRPLLSSSFGPIRDDEGVLEYDEVGGDYEVWAIRHFRQNHSARWKISVFDNNPRRLERLPSRTRDGRSSRKSDAVDDRRIIDRSNVDTVVGGVVDDAPNKKAGGSDGDLRSIMSSLILEDAVRDAICDIDRENYNRLLSLCFR